MLSYIRKDLLDRLKVGTPHHEVVQRAMAACFAVADEASFLRTSIRVNSTISSSERRRQLDELATGPLAERIDRAWEPFIPIQASLDASRRDRHGSGYVSPTEQQTADNLSLVQAAMFFARRDLKGQG